MSALPVELDEPIAPQVVFNKAGDAFFLHTCHGRDYKYKLDKRWTKLPGQDSITPSINCIHCPAHGFWTKGVWHPV